MTPEERERMNALCFQIQQEKDYAKFEALSSELNDLVSSKQRRFPERQSLLTSPTEKAWKLMPAFVQKILPPRYGQQFESVEISFPEAEYLFREIRIENSFVDTGGHFLSLTPGTKLGVRFEADAESLVKKTERHT